MKTPPLPCAALCLLLASFDLAVASAERIREGETKQEALRSDARHLVEQLDSMLGEYERNGLGGEDAQTVRAVRSSIERLTADEMKQVVALLEKARGSADEGTAKKTVAEAYAAQKAILTGMQRLLDQHRRNQQALELSQALTQLADRQSTNLQNGIALGQWAGGRKPENFEAAMQANLEGQKSEQAAIAAELKLAAERVASFAKDAPNAEAAARFQKGMEAAQKVQPGVEAAAEALAQGQLFKAVAEEKNARDALRRLAREVAPPQEPAAALRAAERELGKMVEEQRELAANTQNAVPGADFEKWLDRRVAAEPALQKRSREDLRRALRRQFDDQQAAGANQLPALEAPQGDLAARSDLLAQDVQKNAPAAAQALQSAQEKMQDARAGMAEKNGELAVRRAQEATAQLETARARLAQEAAKAEALAGKSGDPVKDLQALQQQAEQLARQQAAAAANPDKSGQPALAQQAAQLAQRGTPMAPPAAQALQQAAANAQQAAQAAQPAQAAQAQQAAAQNLQQAAQQLAQQAAAAQQAQQQVAAAQQAAQALAAIIVVEQQLELETAKSLAQTSSKDRRYREQSETQTVIKTQAENLKASAAPELADAIVPLDEAIAAMGEAKTHLANAAGEPARTAERHAIDALLEIQQALQQAIAQAQEVMPPGAMASNPAATQAAQAQLAQAAEQLAQSQQSLQNAQAAQAAQAQAQQAGQPNAANASAQQAAAAMQQASQQATQAAAQAGQTAAQGAAANAPAQAAAQQAAQAAAEAAAQAAGNQPGAAQAAASQAQAALAQAQAALSQAQAGLSAAPGSPMPGSGQQPGPPGSKPGSKPGNQPGSPGGTTAAQKYTPNAEESVQMVTRGERLKKANFTGLPPRERAAIEQSQGEKYPEEYGPQVEQYLLNLARESAGR